MPDDNEEFHIAFPLMMFAPTPFGRENAVPFTQGTIIPPLVFVKILGGAFALAAITTVVLLLADQAGLQRIEGAPPVVAGGFATFVCGMILTMAYANASWYSRRLNDFGFPGIILFVMMVGGMSGFILPLWAIFAGVMDFPSDQNMPLLFIPWAVMGAATIIGLLTKSLPGRDDRNNSDPNQIG